MSRKNILLADNDRDFLDTRAELLEAAGYQVIKAATPEAASNVLQDGDSGFGHTGYPTAG